MNNKSYLSVLASLLAAMGMQASPVMPDVAQSIAEKFVGESVKSNRMRKAPATHLKLVHTHQMSQNDSPLFYVFNRDENSGYVLVAGDDRLPAIIGYSTYGNFDSQVIPENMQDMIFSWEQQIQWINSHPDAQKVSPVKPDKAIAPLLGDINWDQGNPYNRKCPTVSQYDNMGNSTGKGAAATGCVATALGQIMYYHKWPEVGTGSISYTSKGEDDTVDVNVVFEGYRYDWTKMLPSLSTSSDSEAIEQVSTLLYHIGAGFESVYGASTGATDVSVAPALKKYFGYDSGVSYLLRDYYTAQDWNDCIMAELSNNRPIAYGGVTRKREGHYFVVDGIDAEGYYHINWGWSGMENGYYLLSLLEPGQQGIGGADSGSAFHYFQNMITGIQPPTGLGTPEQYNFTSDRLTRFDKTVDRNGSAKLVANDVWNNSATPCDANLGFALIDADGKVVYRQWVKEHVNYDIAWGENTLSSAFIIPKEIPEGQYTIRPVYQVSADNYSTDRFIQFPQGRDNRYTATVTDRNIVYATTGIYNLTMLDVTADTEVIKSGVPTKFTVKVKNDGSEFHGPVQLRLFIKGKDKVFGRTDFPKKPLFVSIPANCETELEFETTLDVPGNDNYVFRLWGNEALLDDEGYFQSSKNLCSKEGFKIEGPALPPVLSVADDLIISTAVDGVVPRNDVGIKAYIENEGGPWTGTMRVAVWDLNSWREPVGYIEYPDVTIDGETEMWVNLTDGVLPETAETGKEYELILQDPRDNSSLVPSYYNSINVTVGEKIEKMPKLSLEEVSFDPEQPKAGEETTVTFDVVNDAYEYAGNAYFTVSRNDEVLHKSEPKEVVIPRETTASIEFTETFELPDADDYRVALYDKDDNEIGAKEKVTFLADESKLEMVSLIVDPSEYVNKGEKATFTFTVRNDGFLYTGAINMDILLDEVVKLSANNDSENIARGESVEVIFEPVLNLPASDKYVVRLLNSKGEVIGEHKYLEVRDLGGVKVITDSAYSLRDGILTIPGMSEISVYSTDGRLMLHADGEIANIRNLNSGMYIIKAKGNGETIISKIFK